MTVPKALAPKPAELRGRLAPEPVVSPGVRPDPQAAAEISDCLSRVVPVEEEFAALLPVLDALEVLAPVALIRAELPAQVLS